MTDQVESNPYLSFVIPTFGIEESLQPTINEVSHIVKRRIAKPFEIVVPYTPREGDSLDEIDSLSSEGVTIRVIEEARRGYGRAYLTGFENCLGEIIVTLDADLTYPLEFLPNALVHFEEKRLDFLNTDRLSNFAAGAFTWAHNFGNRILSIIMNGLYNTGFVDSQSGMWIIRRNSIPRMELLGIHWEFSAEIKVEARMKGLRCAEVVIPYRPRIEGETTNSWREGLKIAAFLISKKLGLVDQLRQIVKPV